MNCPKCGGELKGAVAKGVLICIVCYELWKMHKGTLVVWFPYAEGR